MIAYKAAWAGKRMIKVPAHHTSQTCISCGHISPENRKTQDLFCCANCGHTAHADVHAAQEIRRRGIEILIAEGLSVSACGELCVSTSVKQEETPALPRVRSENQNRPQRAA
jgi:putative transposase